MHQRGGRGYQDFLTKIFCLTVPKISVGEPSRVSQISDTKKVYNKRREEVSRFSVENFLSHSAENFRRGTLSCFTNFEYRKMLRINRKNFWQGSDWNLEPTAWDRCCPNPTAFICFWIKRVGSFGLEKTTLLNEWFSLYITYTAKNNKNFIFRFVLQCGLKLWIICLELHWYIPK